MSKLRVSGFTISLDGYGAGADQTRENPLGVGGESLHAWLVRTDTFRKMSGHFGDAPIGDKTRGAEIDERFAEQGFENVGAWIMGRNMFTSSRGPWTNDGWKGWWGANPPYHVPVFVLTHHARPSITMEGGTIFHFVTGGIHAALSHAKEAARGKEIRLGGGVATVRAYLSAGLIDEAHFAIAPVLLGKGEALFAGLDLPSLGYKCSTQTASELATHVVLTK